MKGLRFNTTGAPIQVGSMSGASTGTAAIAVSGVIEIAEVTGAGVYVAFGASDMSAPSAEASGAIFIPPYGVTRPFLVPTGNTHVRSSGTKINVRNLAAA
jgi:hypothetical protein